MNEQAAFEGLSALPVDNCRARIDPAPCYLPAIVCRCRRYAGFWLCALLIQTDLSEADVTLVGCARLLTGLLAAETQPERARKTLTWRMPT
jgi:hypothetical protein